MLALLFVAVSLGTGLLTEQRQGATPTFMSPVVIHFTSVFFLSAVALFPSHQARKVSGLRQHRDLFMRPADALKEWHDFYLLVGTPGPSFKALATRGSRLAKSRTTSESLPGISCSNVTSDEYCD